MFRRIGLFSVRRRRRILALTGLFFVVATVILVFFGIGYALGRIFL